jgi:hypothetical protein
LLADLADALSDLFFGEEDVHGGGGWEGRSGVRRHEV